MSRGARAGTSGCVGLGDGEPVATIAGVGTGEDVWLPRTAALPRLDLSPPPARCVVVAPHPDDEVLAVGGLLSLLAAAGTTVEVVAVTDGEASNPGGSVPPAELAARRVLETRRALATLGFSSEPRRLALPDGGAAALAEPVQAAVQVEPGSWLLAPWQRDGHPDHEAVGRACARVAERDGARLLAFPVWAWHWAGADDLPWTTARQVPLPPGVSARKAAAVDCFATQVRPLGPLPADEPVLGLHVLARFARPHEVVFG